MDHYILSRKTQEDIDEIYNYGSYEFGKNKALDYLMELQTYFQFLLDNPEIGKHRYEIKEGLYSFPYASHIIFYRIFDANIRIVRVLHGSRDLKKFLK